jgi:antitoxin HigA-1
MKRRERIAPRSRVPFPHPGETIREDYLIPLEMSVNRLALELRVPATRMAKIVHGWRGITADTALRLARYFNTTPKFWLNLQTSYDLAIAAETSAKEIARTVHPHEAAYVGSLRSRSEKVLFDRPVSQGIRPAGTGQNRYRPNVM